MLLSIIGKYRGDRQEKIPYHKDHRGSAGKHVLATNRAIALQVPLNTLVVQKSSAHADVAFLAVEKIFAQSLSDAADPTVVTVIDLLPWVIVPELADVAVVFCKSRLAG